MLNYSGTHKNERPAGARVKSGHRAWQKLVMAEVLGKEILCQWGKKLEE
jgi:hypothetical protein